MLDATEGELDFLSARSPGLRMPGIISIFGLVDDFANTAKIVGIEGEFHGVGVGHRLRVGRKHLSPRERLHDIPVTARGEKPSGQSENQ